MQIGSLTLKNTAALAPMAGVADRAFREICVALGACYVVGEMASSKGIQYKSRKTAELLSISEAERPCAVQLFGDEAGTMADAAVVSLQYKPNIIDINMGCPAPKIAGGGSGSALMKNLPLAADIIKSVVSAVDLPVTVKIRKGWDDNLVNAVETAVMAEAMGASAITVHGRTRQQMYQPPVDISIIRDVKNAVTVPVIGNGDVVSVDSAIEMYDKTGCDLVMIGRGALGAPWLFRQIDAYITRGERQAEPELDEKMAIMLRHIRLACDYKGEKVAMREARRHVGYYLKGLRGAADLRRRASGLEYYDQLEALAKEILDGNLSL